MFEIGNDPIQLGLVDSLNRPGGNVTGANQMNIEVAPKRLELLHEVLPSEHIIALLVDPADPNSTNTTIRDVRAAARNLGLEVRVLNASCEADFEAAFAKLRQLRAGGLVIGGGPFFVTQSQHMASLSVHHAIPTIYAHREFVTAGGLMSYGSDITDALHVNCASLLVASLT